MGGAESRGPGAEPKGADGGKWETGWQKVFVVEEVIEGGWDIPRDVPVDMDAEGTYGKGAWDIIEGSEGTACDNAGENVWGVKDEGAGMLWGARGLDNANMTGGEGEKEGKNPGFIIVVVNF